METTVVIHAEEPILNVILPEVESDEVDLGIFDETFDETFE